MTLFDFIHSQVWTALPYPTKSFAGQTIVVTGSNVGLGLEAARHFVRLDAAKVILAVRTVSKGLEAAESIAQTTNREGVVDVWELDLESYASVQAFAKKAMGLDRLDVVVENAGVYEFDFAMAEDSEKTITVNVISTLLLGILLLPKLRESSMKLNKRTVLTFTGSFVHQLTSFPERVNENIFEYLTKREKANMMDRYNVSKLMQLFLIREFADQVTKSESSSSGRVTVSVLNPGYVKTSIMRHAGFFFAIYNFVLKTALARSTEIGSRTLVNAAEGNEGTHGQYLDDCKIGRVSAFVRDEEGQRTQKKLWKELSQKLEHIHPGIMQNI